MFLNDLKGVFNRIGNISNQNKDIGVVSVRKACLIQAVLKNFVAKNSENS